MLLFFKAVKRGEESEGLQEACTELSDWAAGMVGGCIQETREQAVTLQHGKETDENI